LNKIINVGKQFKKIAPIRNFMHSLLSALDFIHSKGAMHRDIKTNNLMVNRLGQVKIVDFDLSEFLNTETLSYGVSTNGFKPPESFLG
jgi:serine/threonine protein kinase